MASERQLWKWLSGGNLPLGHYSRIESDTSQGFPDVDYCIRGIEGTIELKVSRKPKAQYPFKIGGLRDDQVRWISKRIEHGGHVWIILQVGIERFILNGRWAADVNWLTTGQLRRLARYRFPPKGKHSSYLKVILCE